MIKLRRGRTDKRLSHRASQYKMLTLMIKHRRGWADRPYMLLMRLLARAKRVVRITPTSRAKNIHQSEKSIGIDERMQ